MRERQKRKRERESGESAMGGMSREWESSWIFQVYASSVCSLYVCKCPNVGLQLYKCAPVP